MLLKTLRQAKRFIIAVIGSTVVLIGIVMLVTPGPGWVVIFLGLSVLAAEFVWARRLLKRLKEKGKEISRSLWGLCSFRIT
jgi:uncharacterized protein (TIGR02611 family)